MTMNRIGANMHYTLYRWRSRWMLHESRQKKIRTKVDISPSVVYCSRETCNYTRHEVNTWPLWFCAYYSYFYLWLRGPWHQMSLPSVQYYTPVAFTDEATAVAMTFYSPPQIISPTQKPMTSRHFVLPLSLFTSLLLLAQLVQSAVLLTWHRDDS